MPCIACGRWSHAFRWSSQYRPAGPDPAWEDRFYPDPDQDHLYWFIRCTPSCRANALLCSIDHFERHLSSELRLLRRLVEEAYWEVEQAWEVIDS